MDKFLKIIWSFILILILTSSFIPVVNNHEIVSQIDNKGIEFKYELSKTTNFGEHFLIEIKCTITNKTNNEVNYLCHSCNGLEYYLVFNPNSYRVAPVILCNASWPIIRKISANSSIEFNTNILKLKDSNPLENIGLDLRLVDTFIPFDTLKQHPEKIEKIYRAAPQKDNIIWSRNK